MRQTKELEGMKTRIREKETELATVDSSHGSKGTSSTDWCLGKESNFVSSQLTGDSSLLPRG